LAKDETPTIDALKHVIGALREKDNYHPAISFFYTSYPTKKSGRYNRLVAILNPMKCCLLRRPLLRAYCSFLRVSVLRAFPNYSATSLINAIDFFKNNDCESVVRVSETNPYWRKIGNEQPTFIIAEKFINYNPWNWHPTTLVWVLKAKI
jgi:hypothetical protein